MLSPITTFALALLTVAMLLLRIFWLRVPTTVRLISVRIAILLILVELIFTITKWSTSSDSVNHIIRWLAVVGYELLLMLFTRMAPRWLTSICTLILLVPLFAASVLQPLMQLFTPTMSKPNSIGKNLDFERNDWGKGSPGNSGSELLIYYQPRLIPLLRHDLVHVPFNNHQCNAGAAYAELGPIPKTILAHCPHWPSQGPGSEDRLIPLP